VRYPCHAPTIIQSRKLAQPIVGAPQQNNHYTKTTNVKEAQPKQCSTLTFARIRGTTIARVYALLLAFEFYFDY
jgi:hypothetical protein